jgi:hypothetical protein
MTPDTAAPTQSPVTKREKPDADDQQPSTQLKEAGRDPAKLAELWEKELQAAKKELTKFHTTGRKLVKKYLDDRDGASFDSGMASLNLFWSNTQVLMSSLYAKPPRVDVSNAFKDTDDDISRVAGNILERMLNHDIEEDDESTFPEVTQQAVGDYLIVGLGQVWYRYEVDTETQATEAVTDPTTGTVLAAPVEYEAIVDEDAPADYVYWEDFWWSPARTWQDVRWVARRVFMNREELIARFGEKIGKDIPVSKQKKDGGRGPENDPWEKAGVFEIWDKTTKCAYWHVMGYNIIADYKEDPLKLRGFFPCPKPMVANPTTTTLMPRADYLLAQDQYQQINDLTTRLKYLIKACKVVGVYDKNSTPVGRIFSEGMENQMIPVDNWSAFAEKGGLKGQMDFVPIEVIASVIQTLTLQRDVLKQGLYEVLGIGDIMRGQTDPDETLGAQQLKAQFGGNRLQFKQQSVGNWVAAGQRIRAQIICTKFQPQTIMERSNIEHSQDAPMAQQAIQFLKDAGNGKIYRISIESETMAMVDWAQERDSRTQFMTAVGNFVTSTAPLLEAKPEAAPIVLQMMKWGLGGFRVSKEIETVLDQAIAAAQQPAEEKTDPVQEAEIAEKQAKTEQAAASAQKSRADALKANADTLLAFGSYPMPPEQAGFGIPVPGQPMHAGLPEPAPTPPGAAPGVEAGEREPPQMNEAQEPPEGPGGMPMQPPPAMASLPGAMP